jgi:acetoin utilization deacetylase AcuC-like enzyme
MKLTTAEMARRDRWTIDLCRRWGVPVVVTYGGGYNRADGGTTRLHVQTVSIAAERHRAEQPGAGGAGADGPG